MTSTDYLIHTSTHVTDLINTDRETGHRMTMSLFPHTTHNDARAHWNILWTVLTPTTILLRTTHTNPLHHPDWANSIEHHPTTHHTNGETITFTIELAALHTPPTRISPELHHQLKTGANGTPQPPGQGKAYRANKIPVPPEKLHTWLTNKITRHGLQPHTITINNYRTLHLPTHRTTYPVTQAHIHATITNQHTYNQTKTTANQLGKGKPYGLCTITTPNPH